MRKFREHQYTINKSITVTLVAAKPLGFGGVRVQLGLAAADAFASISSFFRFGRTGITRCAESYVFGKEVKVMKIAMTRADLFLRIFEAIPGTLR